jgi:hypothetical protein
LIVWIENESIPTFDPTFVEGLAWRVIADHAWCLLKRVLARLYWLGFWWQIKRKFLCVCLFGSCILKIKN